MQPSEVYTWEIETDNGTILRQFDEEGKEHTWKEIDPYVVVRFTLAPKDPCVGLPSHSVLIDHGHHERFVKRFGRGIMKRVERTYRLTEYINCIETSFYRLWVFSNGQCLVTKPSFEVYI
jgi:hypothetical protein